MQRSKNTKSVSAGRVFHSFANASRNRVGLRECGNSSVKSCWSVCDSGASEGRRAKSGAR